MAHYEVRSGSSHDSMEPQFSNVFRWPSEGSSLHVIREIFRTLGGGTGELGNQRIDQEPGLWPLHIRDTSWETNMTGVSWCVNS